MDDLIEKFFEKDLTEAETKALRDRLASSIEDAERFSERARKTYLLTGLPLPQWPGDLGPPTQGHPGPSHGGPGPGHIGPHFPGPHLFHLGMKTYLLAAALGASGVAGFVLWKKVPSPKPLPDRVPAMVLFAPSPTRSVGPVRRQSVHFPRIEQAEPLVPTVTEVPRPVDPSNGSSIPPRSPYSDLSVAVRRSSPGPVTVKVLDSRDQLVTVLYSGTLEAGNWQIEWDGRLADHTNAPAGIYQIQVESGTYTQKKKIVIR